MKVRLSSSYPSSSTSVIGVNPWQPFYLTSIDQQIALSRGESFAALKAANQFSITIQDILGSANDDNIKHVCLMNYMIDPSWLFQTNPILCKVPVLLLHGHKQAQEALQQTCVHLPNVMSSIVNVEQWGTHHTKMMIIHYSSGIRIAIGTPNLIPGDWALKTQGFYIQDFPLLSSSSSDHASNNTFREDLHSYLKHVGYKINAATQHVLEKQFIDKLKNYDFSSAEVVLIPSVPGHHDVTTVAPSSLSSSSSFVSSSTAVPNGDDVIDKVRVKNKWGHLKLRDELILNRKRLAQTLNNSDAADGTHNNVLLPQQQQKQS